MFAVPWYKQMKNDCPLKSSDILMQIFILTCKKQTDLGSTKEVAFTYCFQQILEDEKSPGEYKTCIPQAYHTHCNEIDCSAIHREVKYA